MSALEHTDHIDDPDLPGSGRARRSLSLSPDESWKRLAACHGQQRLFFPHRSERPQAKARREARARRICATCPVQEPCLEYALEQRIDHGVWGGASERERRRILKRRRMEAAEATGTGSR